MSRSVGGDCSNSARAAAISSNTSSMTGLRASFSAMPVSSTPPESTTSVAGTLRRRGRAIRFGAPGSISVIQTIPMEKLSSDNCRPCRKYAVAKRHGQQPLHGITPRQRGHLLKTAIPHCPAFNRNRMAPTAMHSGYRSDHPIHQDEPSTSSHKTKSCRGPKKRPTKYSINRTHLTMKPN